jgi:hypothetical protein
MCETGQSYAPVEAKSEDTLAAMIREGLGIKAKSEDTLAAMIREDLGINIDPQALRMFLRQRWTRIALLGHRIHGGQR